MNKDEALKLALDWLESGNFVYPTALRTAIKEALAQPEQKPIATVESAATVVSKSGNQKIIMSWWHEPALPVGTKLYTTPPVQPKQEPVAWMTFTDYGDEDDIWYENPEGKLIEGWTYKPLYTTPQPAQDEALEPLEYWNAVEGWVKIDEVRKHFDSVGCGTIYKTAGEDRTPLYTTPPKREWVGLTDKETDDIWQNNETDWESIKRVEAKLKEKNT